MTKVTILGQEPTEKKGKIVLLESLNNNQYFTDEPSKWQNILLLEKNFRDNMDLIYCYDNEIKDDGSRKYSIICLGHFNDGIV